MSMELLDFWGYVIWGFILLDISQEKIGRRLIPAPAYV